VSVELGRSVDGRRAEMLERLLAAAAEELEQVGQDALTIRGVAQRAGLSPATAYTYMASKDHLFAALFWRLLAADPGPAPATGPPVTRLQATLRHLSTVISGSPAIAAAATGSLLGADPSVQRLRLVIGARVLEYIRAAIGERADEPAGQDVVDAVSLAFFGALLEAGMGLSTYERLGDRLDRVVAVILEGVP
jgi:AcrR family transcriptional regulator